MAGAGAGAGVNDIIYIPIWLVLPLVAAVNWPITLAVTAVLIVVGIFVPRRWAQVVSFVLAAPLVADLLWVLLAEVHAVF